MSIEEQLLYQLERIADSLEIIAGNPKVLKATAEQMKELEFICSTPVDTSSQAVEYVKTMCKEVHQDIVEEWNRELVPLGVPKITAIRNNRAKMVAARIKEHGKESFHQCIEEVKQSSFLLGRTQRPWTKFNFDWMICPNNFIKVLEGNYNDARNNQDLKCYSGSSLPESWAK